MKLQQFLEHHGLRENPFGQEDAQSDRVFKEFCAAATYHPSWDKIYGSPQEPATAVVFGEKGAGKTALRLQIVRRLSEHNAEHPEERVFVVEYDDFNPFLDNFAERFTTVHRRERLLKRWRLWDHMDAILSLAVTTLVDDVLDRKPDGPFSVSKQQLANLTREQKRDLLMLAAFYDHTLGPPPKRRWSALRRALRFANWRAHWDLALGGAVTIVLLAALLSGGHVAELGRGWPWLVILVAWLPYLWRQLKLCWLAWRVSRQVRVLEHHVNSLRQILARFEQPDLIGQPAPSRERSDDRYELLTKLQAVLNSLGFAGVVAVVDRVDEPHLINGSPEKMRELLWPMFDNKFLKHSGIGFKLLLPIEVSYHLSRETKEFYERSRLDKQNLVRSLQWTGESLFDLANDRIRACGNGESPASLQNFFDDSITRNELIVTLDRLRAPRHLFKFIHRLVVDHCNRFTDDEPRWKINRETMQSTLALYLRDLEEFDRGQGTG